MSEITTQQTCSTCRHYHRYGPEPRGDCFFAPPTVLPANQQRRPLVKDGDVCAHHDGSAPPATKEKVNPETPGHAARAARQERQAGKATP